MVRARVDRKPDHRHNHPHLPPPCLLALTLAVLAVASQFLPVAAAVQTLPDPPVPHLWVYAAVPISHSPMWHGPLLMRARPAPTLPLPPPHTLADIVETPPGMLPSLLEGIPTPVAMEIPADHPPCLELPSQVR